MRLWASKRCQMKSSSKKPFHPGNHKELFEERLNDSYKLPGKLHEPTVCPTCEAVYQKGRWQWLPRPENADEVVCAACHRIADNCPAGFINIEGKFAAEHRQEMLRLLHNHEDYAKKEHPMERIIAIDESPEQTVVTTTDIHLARNMAMALKDAFHGTLQLNYSLGQNLLRAYVR